MSTHFGNCEDEFYGEICGEIYERPGQGLLVGGPADGTVVTVKNVLAPTEVIMTSRRTSPMSSLRASARINQYRLTKFEPVDDFDVIYEFEE